MLEDLGYYPHSLYKSLMSSAFRALLLAGGYGTRLRPLTLATPKCLVPIGGVPLLEHWLRKLEDAGCESVLINTHYLSDRVVDFVNARAQSNMKLELVYEQKLLGTAGTLMANKEFFRGLGGLLIHADNLMEEDLGKLLDAHANRDPSCSITMLTFVSDNPTTCGIVELDKHGRVVGFHEKVKDPPGNLANAAVYVFQSDIFSSIGDHEASGKILDFSIDIVPGMLGRIQSYETEMFFIDVGTPEAFSLAQKRWRSLK